MDKLRAIRFFCRTVEARSFAAAAHSLDVVPSALSKAVAALEREVGFTLFNRTTRKLSLTMEGQAYYARCRAIVRELDDAEIDARGGAAEPRGLLRVGLHPALRGILFPALRGLLDAHPLLRLETFITNSPTSLLDQSLDVVLCVGALADSTLVVRRLGGAALVVCAAPDYLRRWGEPRTPGDLRRHRAIIPARADEARSTEWEFTRGKTREIVAVPVRLIVRDGVGLVDAGAGGGGVIRPYEIAARAHLTSGRLKALLPEWSSPHHPIHAVFPGGRSVPAKVRIFVDFAGALLDG
jgi:LysR family transcriptional regulator for bpeEF and oprC